MSNLWSINYVVLFMPTVLSHLTCVQLCAVKPSLLDPCVTPCMLMSPPRPATEEVVIELQYLRRQASRVTPPLQPFEPTPPQHASSQQATGEDMDNEGPQASFYLEQSTSTEASTGSHEYVIGPTDDS